MSQPIISVENLSKYYRLGEMKSAQSNLLSLKTVFGANKRNNHSRDLWALKDVSFEVPAGQVMGVVGRNGAGKSTLLKILSRITDPTEGRAVVRGRVGSLLEVGTGFHPELTGRENVFLNGSILGMSAKEIRSKFDEIVDFSEIGHFIDTPVKRYSSGMFTRLAFAVAANLDPEILIIDEVLSVGDAAFQKKCLVKIRNLMKSGRTVLFVSHNIGSVSELCSSAILLHKGRILTTGTTTEVIEQYARLIAQESANDTAKRDLADFDAASVRITSVGTRKASGAPDTVFDISDELVLEIDYEVRAVLETLQMAIIVSRNMSELFSSFDTDDLEMPLVRRDPGKYRATLRIPAHFLKAGSYSVGVDLGTVSTLLLDVPSAAQFTVEELSENTAYRGYKRERLGAVICPGAWTTTSL
jgi:lipopolysaccharide transport system ATP-binding protein